MIDHDNLEEFADAAYYDFEDSSDTGLAFYSALAQETGGPVLEIACGTGRIALPIAREGLDVTGLDIVPGMLERARSKSGGLPVHWVEADARAFALDRTFRLIFLTGNAFQAFLTRADQEGLLGCVHTHLDDEGLFAFETRNPRWARSDEPGDQPLTRGQELFAFLEDWPEEMPSGTCVDSEGREVRLSRTQRYDHVAQVLHWTTYRRWWESHREQTRITRIAVRFTFPQELAALLHHNGFALLRQFGDWSLEPLSAASPSIIVVCRKRKE